MSKFPQAPDWEKVAKTTNHIIESLDTLKLTFTEKYNVLMMAQSMLHREFIGANIISWLDNQYKQEQKELKKGKTPGTV